MTTIHLSEDDLRALRDMAQADLDQVAACIASGGSHPYDGDECEPCRMNRGIVAIANELLERRRLDELKDQCLEICLARPSLWRAVGEEEAAALIAERERRFGKEPQ